MRINDVGLNLIKEFEGCKLTAYRDIAGILTIGYGDTHNVLDGMVITQAEADQRLCDRLAPLEDKITSLVKVQVNENQFSALVCLAYNIGIGNFGKSLLLHCLNTLHYEDAAKQFLVWNKARVKEELVPVEGLTRRRKAEQALFTLSP